MKLKPDEAAKWWMKEHEDIWTAGYLMKLLKK